MVKAILFDFWGTLVENGVRSPIKQVRNILNIRLPFSEYVIRMEEAMMTREFETLKEAFQAIGKEFGFDCPDFILDELVGMWNKSWMLAQPYDETKEILAKLQEKHTLILVSNTDNISVSNVLGKFELEQYFDKIVLSCEVGQLKTNPEFLRTVIEDLGLQSEDCLLVGDSILSDMKAAKQVGIPSLLVDRHGTREYDPKIKNLHEIEEWLQK